MNIMHLNFNDKEGGAARAMIRLHRGLKVLGLNSIILVRSKNFMEMDIFKIHDHKYANFFSKIRSRLEKLILIFYQNRKPTPWNFSWLPSTIRKKIIKLRPDVIHIHWIASGYSRLSELSGVKNCKYIWTLHDSWAFTGGCHIVGSCEAFASACGKCPQLGSQLTMDISRFGIFTKKKFIDNNQIIFVAPSRWMRDQAQKSFLLKNKEIIVIPNGIDIATFLPIEKKIARQLNGIGNNKKIILFGAMSSTTDPNKGFDLLLESFKLLSEKIDPSTVEIIVFGSIEKLEDIKCGFNITSLGYLDNDIALCSLYSAADVVCVPSRQESFGQTAMEAMACGTPVVAYDTSGLRDIVDHNLNGYLAKCFDPNDFAIGIYQLLNNEEIRIQYSENARLKVETCFSLQTVSSEYVKVYKKMKEYNEISN